MHAYDDEHENQTRFDPDNPECPQCGAAMYDNRADNRQNPGKRRPDFRCKRDREHVIWPPRDKDGPPPRRGQKQQGGGKRGYSVGDLPDDRGEEQPRRPALAVHRAPEPEAPAAVVSPLDPARLAEATRERRDRICANMKTAITYFGRKADGEQPGGMLALMTKLDIGYTEDTVAKLITSLFIALNDGRIR
jgi:hypothetical protein